MTTVNQNSNKAALPPSAQIVLDILDDGTPMTFKDMTSRVDIAPRTIRYALKRLKENGLIIEKFNFKDARQVFYLKRTPALDEKIANNAAALAF